ALPTPARIDVPPPVVLMIDEPAGMSCPLLGKHDMQLTWSGVAGWQSGAPSGACNGAGTYRVRGHLQPPHPKAKLTAESLVPETGKWAPAAGGADVVLDANGA